MLKDHVLRLLSSASEPLSGQGMSKTLGVSRAAVWKAMESLRAEGYVIHSRPGLGYRLLSAPDLLSPGELLQPGQAVGNRVVCLPVTDSTNNECKRLAAQGAESGLVVIAGEQTGGKGRRGRSFQSLPGKGLYLSVLLRPQVSLQEVSQLTAWCAVAVCRAVDSLTGLSCRIKWVNDPLLEGKKLCGILCELGVDDDGRLDYVVAGMGINVSQTAEDFGPELSRIATSLGQHMAAVPRRSEVAAALIRELNTLWASFPAEKAPYLEEYRRRCITTGHEVRLLQAKGERTAFAERINEDFTLHVRLPDGSEEDVFSGEASVRGIEGYA
ncbi:MAG: biotin--[acetyl-CoA-carboxylase] ligase [Oscillospiraceae bacterium]|jgi:BirA family biotin operon repressor/biotin-[acetyl-CoA-carboxylase] ligase|nr:biotin--[acetyl-CoA-carboxylase] ligase [Oscillospiraceae bacterium]